MIYSLSTWESVKKPDTFIWIKISKITVLKVKFKISMVSVQSELNVFDDTEKSWLLKH